MWRKYILYILYYICLRELRSICCTQQLISQSFVFLIFPPIKNQICPIMFQFAVSSDSRQHSGISYCNFMEWRKAFELYCALIKLVTHDSSEWNRMNLSDLRWSGSHEENKTEWYVKQLLFLVGGISNSKIHLGISMCYIILNTAFNTYAW